jgi:hypothetical protein
MLSLSFVVQRRQALSSVLAAWAPTVDFHNLRRVGAQTKLDLGARLLGRAATH